MGCCYGIAVIFRTLEDIAITDACFSVLTAGKLTPGAQICDGSAWNLVETRRQKSSSHAHRHRPGVHVLHKVQWLRY